MGWASGYIDGLLLGENVSFRPRGNSMTPKIRSGQKCTVSPIEAEDVRVGDIVLCRVKGKDYLHIVKAIRQNRFLIGNNHGGINGWIGPRLIFGKLVKVED